MFRIVPLLAFLSLPAWAANVPVDVLTLFAPDEHELFSLPIQGHGNGNIHIKSIAIDSDATLAVSWVDRPDAGIDIRDLSGTLLRSFSTGRFAAAQLSFSQDHSLWALGWQYDEARFREDKQDYRTLRKYSVDGKETGGYLPRSLFAAGLPPGNDAVQSRRITVTADRVGVEIISSKLGNQRDWVDQSNEFPGVAFASDDQAYVHRHNRDTKSIQTFRLNRTTSSWDFARWPDSIMLLSWFLQP